jgi:hypothetical protein
MRLWFKAELYHYFDCADPIYHETELFIYITTDQDERFILGLYPFK